MENNNDIEHQHMHPLTFMMTSLLAREHETILSRWSGGLYTRTMGKTTKRTPDVQKPRPISPPRPAEQGRAGGLPGRDHDHDRGRWHGGTGRGGGSGG